MSYAVEWTVFLRRFAAGSADGFSQVLAIYSFGAGQDELPPEEDVYAAHSLLGGEMRSTFFF